MEENKSDVVKHILASDTFRNADDETKDEIINEIAATGELSKDDILHIRDNLNKLDVSYLESLPYDVFVNVILAGNIRGKDIIRLCNASTKLNKYCHKDYRLKDGRILDQYLFRRLLEKEFQYGDSEDFKDYYPRELYEEFAIQNFRDLIYLLEDILSVGSNKEIILPKTLKELLYRLSNDIYSSHIPLLSDLQIDPKAPDYGGLLWTKDILNNGSNIIRTVSQILNLKTTETDVRIYAQKLNMSLEQLLDFLIKNVKLRQVFSPTFKAMLEGMLDDRNFFNSVHNILLGYEAAYQLILRNSLPTDYDELFQMIKHDFLELLDRESRNLGVKYEDDLITKNISQEFKDARDRLNQIRKDLNEGVYDHVIDYLILLHKKIIDGKLSVLTPVDAEYL